VFAAELTPIAADELAEELEPYLQGTAIAAVDGLSVKFLRDYLNSGRSSAASLELAIRCIQRPTALQPLLFRILVNHFREENREAIARFTDLVRDVDVIVLHLSCRARLHLALASAESFVERGRRLLNVIIVGHETASFPPVYEFDAASKILTVPAIDFYEGLGRKIGAAYRFLAFCGVNACILKVDDDIRCNQAVFKPSEIVDFAGRHNYAGRVIDTRSGYFQRCWHFGKCKTAELNKTPYSMIGHARYAEGPAYVLSPRCVRIVARSSVFYCQEFDNYGFEDMAVGKILNSFRVFPFHWDLRENGSLISTDDQAIAAS